MNKKLTNLKKDDRGYSFLFVIFGVIFVAAIGVIALTMASNYFITTKVDEKTTKNFYTTESIVQEIRTGLQEYANDAAEEAYKEIVEKYNDVSGTTREDKFSVSFLSKLADKLVGTGISWDGTVNGRTDVCDVDTIKALTTKPDTVSVAPSKSAILVVLNNKSCADGEYELTVKNIYVEYTDAEGYNSTIMTDILVKVPDYHFDGDSTFNELKNYIVISDDTLDLKNSASHNAPTGSVLPGVTLMGNIYTGNDENSINIDAHTQVLMRSNRIISRGSLNALTDSDVKITGRDGDTSLADLWLMNFKLSPNTAESSSGLSTHVDLRANSYIENDLVVDDANTEISMSGTYYGYSYNKENTENTTDLKSMYSSAFLINGIKTTLNTSGLNKLILAGRTFVSRNDSSGNAVTSDIQMGESLSVKGNQVAYLVPDKYINKGHNPVFQDEYSSGNVNKTRLIADLGEFLDTSDPVSENYKQAVSGSNGYVYYFLKFKDEVSANEYFKQYYSDEENKQGLIDNERVYITLQSENTFLDGSLYLLAGSILKYRNSTGDLEAKEANYFDANNKPTSELLNDGLNKGVEYVGRQKTLLARGGSKMRMELESNKDPLVSSKIINFSELTTMVKKDYADLDASILLTPSNYTITSATKKGIVIAKGDVTVNSNFEGLIIAGGKVKFQTGALTAKNNIVLVKAILRYVAQDDELKKYFIGVDTFDGNADEGVSMADYVSYKNWSKND